MLLFPEKTNLAVEIIFWHHITSCLISVVTKKYVNEILCLIMGICIEHWFLNYGHWTRIMVIGL